MKLRITRSIVPNLLTLANLFSGFTAIVHIADLQFEKAALFILMAAIFDMLDGAMARLFNSASEFGVELDSLCDAVSFGVAPSYMLYKAHFEQYGEFGILLAAIPALAGVVRLARFNVKLNSYEDKKYFYGLPIPSGALTIISYLIFFYLTDRISEDFKAILTPFVSFGVATAMVTMIKYHNIPKPTKKNLKESPLLIIGIAGAIIAGITTKGLSIFPTMVIYVLGTALVRTMLWIKAKTSPEDEIDEYVDDIDNDEGNYNL